MEEFGSSCVRLIVADVPNVVGEEDRRLLDELRSDLATEIGEMVLDTCVAEQNPLLTQGEKWRRGKHFSIQALKSGLWTDQQRVYFWNGQVLSGLKGLSNLDFSALQTLVLREMKRRQRG